jgi:putative glutamine amidotransferase
MRSLIAVIGRRIKPGGVVGWPHRGAVAVAVPYVEAIQRSGAVDAVVYPSETLDTDGLLERVDGLVLIGGADVDPRRYGAEPHPKVFGVDPVQDDVELAIVRGAVECDVPLLAICRGMQVLNVALGGTLVQHLPDVPGTSPHTVPDASEAGGRFLHPVDIEAGSRVAKAMGVLRPDCPSSHHQAVDAVGAGLRVVGRADDGVIEAVEYDDGWIVGVQWHPESSADTDAAQQALFDALVEQSATRRS